MQYALDNIKEWVKPTPAVTPLFLKPAYTDILPSFLVYFLLFSVEIVHEPVGVILIIGPWNYPLQLIFNPLIAAFSAGNVCAIKPSEIASHVSAVIAKLVPKYVV